MGAPAPWSNNDVWEKEYVEDLRVFILSVMMPMHGSFLVVELVSRAYVSGEVGDGEWRRGYCSLGEPPHFTSSALLPQHLSRLTGFTCSGWQYAI